MGLAECSKEEMFSAMKKNKLKKEDINAAIAKTANTTATNANSKAQAINTITTTSLSNSFKILKDRIWSATTAMFKWLITTPAGWITIAATAITGMVVALTSMQKASEKAHETTVEKIRTSLYKRGLYLRFKILSTYYITSTL